MKKRSLAIENEFVKKAKIAEALTEEDTVNLLAITYLRHSQTQEFLMQTNNQYFESNYCDKDGNSLLHLAVDYKDIFRIQDAFLIIDVLLYCGANQYLENKLGKTPVELAEEKGFDDIVELFKEHENQSLDGNIYLMALPDLSVLEV
jgi:ankyrin repeat protein